MARKKFMRRFFHRKNHRLKIEDFDTYILEDLKKANQRAKLLLGVEDAEVNAFPPLLLTTPIEERKGIKPILVYGEDKLRYDLANFNAVYFGKHSLFCYSTMIDHKTGSSYNDRAMELSYIQIQSIETSIEFKKINKTELHIFKLKLVLSELKSIVIPLRVMLIDIKTPKEDYLLDPELLNLATNLKSFLREKLAF
ncbi:MAG: hypothetical protein GX149_03505 [Acholeplasmataceae bacterium]|jgi:hypothetical protein|nr:hypothetical protein [Acholeplasmataceae bacterium]